MVLAAVNVALICVCAVLYLRTDRTAPEIAFSVSDTVYREGIDAAELLEGVKAHDRVEGELTDCVVIEKIIEDRERSCAVVYYAVSDTSGNVAKASRVFEAVYEEEEKREEGEGGFPAAGIDAEISLYGRRQTVVKKEESGEEKEREEALGEEEEMQSAPPSPTPLPSPARAPQKTPEAAEEKSPEPTQKPVPTPDPSVPLLTLKVSEVKVKAGQGPAWVEIIGVLSDDKDSYETLFRNLSVSRYDRNKAGSYAVTVRTEDSDGNSSAGVPLTIIVEE